MKKRRIVWALAAVGALLCWRVIGQSLSPQQLLDRAEQGYQDNDFPAAYQDWDTVRTQAAGSEAGQKAEFELAAMQASLGHNFAQARASYQKLSSQNQGTLAGLMADFSLADMDLAERKVDVTGYWARLDGLIRRTGGPSLAEVSRFPSDHGQQVRLSVRRVAGLDPQMQYFLLCDLYDAAAGSRFGNFKNNRVNNRSHYEFLCSPAELQRAIQIQRFVIQNWAFAHRGDELVTMGSLQDAELSLQGLPPREPISLSAEGATYAIPDTRAPVVDRLVPRPDSRVSARQMIGFRISDGDIQQSQLDLNRIQVTLDGNKINDQMELQKRFYPRSKKGYLVVSGRSVPTLRLSPGPHTVSVWCDDHDGNKTDKVWHFQVRKGDSGGDQECDDDDDRDLD